ncbi:hypothetical protein Pint_06260 [Pistacia integerrima]|uniref:Uncharacterized protein n=1 Tax=Pistacia integerrima TaxID=434235 RepID=A0ACC0Z5Q2_9ROSI|nr:hypothetical protein Pint_06260 [Pistacia integerrima]
MNLNWSRSKRSRFFFKAKQSVRNSESQTSAVICCYLEI